MILFYSILVWNFATVCQGLSNTYTQLLLTRILNGAGQSANLPTAFSLIADFVPAENLAQVSVCQPLTWDSIVAGACQDLSPCTSCPETDNLPTKQCLEYWCVVYRVLDSAT